MTDATTGSTYHVVNLIGSLFQLDPDDTPFLAMAGGLNGGRSAGTPIFTWQTESVGAGAAVTGIAEGVDPSMATVDRSEVVNVCQIFNQAVEVTYTKQAATNRLGDYGASRAWSIQGDQPVQNELGHQLELATMSIARDVDWAFLNGTYQLPTDNTTGRQTRGLITATTTNSFEQESDAVGTTWDFDFTGGASEDLWTTAAAHGLVVGDEIVFTTADAAPAEYVAATSYWVVAVPLATTVQLSATKGGAVLAGTADATAGNWVAEKRADLSKAMIDTLMKSVFDNGGLTGGSMPVFFCGSGNKTRFSTIYGYAPEDRFVGGVNISTIETDFARVGVVIDRNMPRDVVLLADMSVVKPVTLPIPGKGHFFGEELATTGPKWNWMVYGEIGLEYGPEQRHGVISGLTSTTD